ncbi:MAG: hypothetical protein Kow0068_22040 [Marinilabiliales bacterium]
MHKLIVFFSILILFPLVLFTQSNIKKIYLSDVNYFTPKVFINDDGYETYEYELNENIPDAYYKVYYKEDFSTLYMEGAIENNKKEGVWIFYNEFGKLKCKTEYHSGEKNGLEKKYDLNGNLIETSNYERNLLNGERIQYYPSGAKRTLTKFINDQPVGYMTVFDENGEVIKKINIPN